MKKLVKDWFKDKEDDLKRKIRENEINEAMKKFCEDNKEVIIEI
jgi:hypothetical protein